MQRPYSISYAFKAASPCSDDLDHSWPATHAEINFGGGRLLAVTLDPSTVTPFRGEIEEAKRTPGGWVYRIAGPFGPKDRVPPEAIVGAWKVDADGKIVGGFVRNKNYDPNRWAGRHQ